MTAFTAATSALRRPVRQGRNALAVLGALLCMLWAFPSAGSAAGPELSVAISHSPTVFKRGDIGSFESSGAVGSRFLFQVTNTGDEEVTGPINLEMTFSSGLALRVLAGGGIQSCTAAFEVRQGAPFVCTSPGRINPGETQEKEVAVFVETDAPDSVTASAVASGGNAVPASGSDTVDVIDRPPFGVSEFSARAVDAADADYTVAGGHPYSASSSFSLPEYAGIYGGDPVEDPRNVYVELPPGFVGAAAAAERCTISKLSAGAFFPECPEGSKIGEFTLFLNNGRAVGPYGLYNVVPEKGYPAEFGFKFLTNSIILYPKVRPRTKGYGIDITTPGASRLGITGASATFFGVPSLHNGVGGPEIPFVSNPVDCANASPRTRIIVDTWQHPARLLSDGFPDLSDPLWAGAEATNPQVTDCDDPALVDQWKPTIETSPSQGSGNAPIRANQPSGLDVQLDFPQSNDPTDSNTVFDPSIPQAPELKTATVKLPAGLAISPSSADGLGACSDQAADPAGDQVRYDDTLPVRCPDASKIGTVTATSPLLAKRDPKTDAVIGAEPVSGDVYVLKPHPGDLSADGKGDGKFRLLIAIENENLGLNVKLPGVAVADQTTGQLTTTFIENPQLPVKHLELHLDSGPRASLATPKTCGTFTTTTDMEAWSAPGTPNEHPTSTFDVGSGPNGTPCVSSLAQRNFAPTLSAGTSSAKAGAASPFVMRIERGDSEQELSTLDVNLPAGLTAKLAGVPYCPEGAIAAAANRSGVAERANPSCPASKVGTVTAGAGPGSNPYYVSGNAYLAGPYKGAPLSFAFITPAVAGPFDLGNVVVRAAAFVDPETARVTVKTDPLPQILDGVPLGIRSITAQTNRPAFTLNPTSCEAKSISASLGGSNGASASPSTHFQVGDCGALGFKPSLELSLSGETKRSGNPALKAVLTAPPGQANIATTTVVLPATEFIDNAHINNPCTRVQFAASACPVGSILGTATAYSPLLDQPLTGPVYFRSNGGERDLPDIVADLGGQIHVTLVGFIDSVPIKGTEKSRVRTRFLSVPDAPVSRFVLTMKGGKKGLIENSANLCKRPGAATVRMDAQNGRARNFQAPLKTSCKGKKKGGKRSR